MKQLLITLTCCVLMYAAFSQQRYTISNAGYNAYYPKLPDLWDSVMSDTAIVSFTAKEREALYIINLARAHPVLFRDSVVLPYLHIYDDLKPVYGNSLVATLGSMTPVSACSGSTLLHKIAKGHALDMAKQGQISHMGSDGRDPVERLQGIGVGCGSECVHYSSFSTAVEMVLSLLIDFGVKGLGHRIALLSPTANRAGIGLQQTKQQINFLVVNMACN